MANNKPKPQRAADQMMAAIRLYKAHNPNEFNTIQAQPFRMGIAKIEKWLDSDEALQAEEPQA